MAHDRRSMMNSNWMTENASSNHYKSHDMASEHYGHNQRSGHQEDYSYQEDYQWNDNHEGYPQEEGDVMPPGEEEDRSYRQEQSYRSDRDRYREHENRDRDRKRRSRSRSRSHEDRRRRREKKKRDRNSESGSSRSRSRSRSRERRRRSRSRERSRRDWDRPSHDYDNRDREYDRGDSWKNIPPNNTIMVSNLPLHVTENEIRADILQHNLVPKDIRLIRRKDTGTSRGFAFVEFSTLPEAVRWMESNQGYLVLEDQFRASLQYSISKDAPGEKMNKAAQDWFCINCGEHNFKRREVCFKCQSPRSESEMSNDVQREVSLYPTSTVLLRNLDVLTTEDKVLNAMQSLPGVASLPIKSVRIGRDQLTNVSRGVCYLDMNSTGDAMRLYAGLSEAGQLIIDCKEVALSYCKLATSATTAATVAAIAKAGTPAAVTAVAAAQWSVSNAAQPQQNAPAAVVEVPNFTREEIPRLAEYSASMYAKTPEEHAHYLQYYTQYYTDQLQSATTSAASAANHYGAEATTAAAPPDLSKFTYDEKSGYYYDTVSNLYYDSQTQYFYNPQTQLFSYWDYEKNSFVAVPNAGNTDAKAGAAAAGGSAADKEEKKEKSGKQDKVTVAKKIAKDMEKWAKTLNQRKESAKVAVQPPAPEPVEPKKKSHESDSGETEKSSLSEVLHVANLLQRNRQLAERRSAAAAEALVAYGSDSDSDNVGDTRKSTTSVESLIDWNKLACLLCKRQFKDKETLTKHQQLSDLHKQNLEAWKMQNTPASYRDRAKERREKFGDADPPPVKHSSHRYHKDSVKQSHQRQDMDASNYADVPSHSGASGGSGFGGPSNVGSKLLQKMGWQEGQGLGKSNQGRTTIIEAERRTASAGLGMKTYAVAGDNYRDSVKKLAQMRFKELNNE